MEVLCLMRLIPDVDGTGGSQRAWHLVQALRRFGSVHFVLVRPQTKAMSETALRQLTRLDPVVASVTSIEVPEWLPKISKPRWAEKADLLLRVHSWEVPRLQSRTLNRIASQLPVRNPDIIFAARLPSALLAEKMISQRLISARTRLADLDDVYSDIRWRLLQHRPLHEKPFLLLDYGLIRRGEGHIIKRWEAVSLSSQEDAGVLARRYRASNLTAVPNVIDRPFLPQRRALGAPKILFVGNLRHEPNVHGLRIFLEQGWPSIKAVRPEAVLDVVGMLPSEELAASIKEQGATLHSNVDSVMPYYEAADLTIAPIFLGSGTRIKLLETMAFGRATVSTTFGAQGLDLVNGKQIVLADSMSDFAREILSLLADHKRREEIALAARAFVVEKFGPATMLSSLMQMSGAR